jgi:hypothetical protein
MIAQSRAVATENNKRSCRTGFTKTSIATLFGARSRDHTREPRHVGMLLV